jgi:putative peptide zinc metalloprotease protein
MDQFIEWCEAHRGKLEGLAKVAEELPIRYRMTLLSGETCERIGARLGKLFARPVACLVLISSFPCIALHFSRNSPAGPGNFWLALLLALAGVMTHELGHISACVRYKARQGGIGVGLYWIWPAFFADVRGSWTLTNGQRAVVSAGGLYFQSMYLASMCAIGLVAPSATLAIAINVSVLLMVTTLNPIFKYDGYWIISDLFNVRNVHSGITAHLRALLMSGKGTRSRLLRSRMTILSVGFAAAATAYILYVFSFLVRMSVHEALQLPLLWLQLSKATDFSMFSGPAWGVAMKLFSGVLELAVLLAAIVVLGNRSLKSAWKICSEG